MSGRTLSAALARYARWIQVVRAQRPHLLPTYPLFFFPTLPILACAIAVHGTIAWLAALVALSARALVAAAAARASGREPSVLGVARDVVVADVTLAIALVRALASREVEWRGRSLQILSGGRLAAH
jgi:ceramide glucosyltransferase